MYPVKTEDILKQLEKLMEETRSLPSGNFPGQGSEFTMNGKRMVVGPASGFNSVYVYEKPKNLF